jgi:fucose 4-O-acetylase-like acetyltransferase
LLTHLQQTSPSIADLGKLGYVQALSEGEPHMRPDDSIQFTQIQICRVICIFLMMSVHIFFQSSGHGDPVPSEASIISTGDLAFIKEIWVDQLGRASVPALSLISGYLLVQSIGRTSARNLACRKFLTLIVPMIIWNAVYLALARLGWGGSAAEGQLSVAALVNGLTGLLGPTVNPSLFFLRDLFASALITLAGLGLIRRFPWAAIALSATVALFGLLQPLVFRPSILMFVVMGAALAVRGIGPRELARPRVCLPVIAAGLGLAALAWLLMDLDHALFSAALDLLRRTALTFAMVGVAGRLATTPLGRRIATLGDDVFLSYLLHLSLFGVAWVVWQKLVGSAMDPSYLLFFFLAPPLALVVGTRLGKATDTLPGAVQILIRGKVGRRAAARRASGSR